MRIAGIHGMMLPELSDDDMHRCRFPFMRTCFPGAGIAGVAPSGGQCGSPWCPQGGTQRCTGPQRKYGRTFAALLHDATSGQCRGGSSVYQPRRIFMSPRQPCIPEFAVQEHRTNRHILNSIGHIRLPTYRCPIAGRERSVVRRCLAEFHAPRKECAAPAANTIE